MVQLELGRTEEGHMFSNRGTGAASKLIAAVLLVGTMVSWALPGVASAQGTGSFTVSTTTVTAGDTISVELVTPPQCYVVLVSLELDGDAPVVFAGRFEGTVSTAITVPTWVAPEDHPRVVGRCVAEDSISVVGEPVPLTVTAALDPQPPAPVVVEGTARPGGVLRVQMPECTTTPTAFAYPADSDWYSALAIQFRRTADPSVEEIVLGPWTSPDIPLNLVLGCSDPSGLAGVTFGPVAVVPAAGTPVPPGFDDTYYSVDATMDLDGSWMASGQGCDAAGVTVRVVFMTYHDPFAAIAVDLAGPYAATPEADGSWSVTLPAGDFEPPDSSGSVMVVADCGDPVVDGFRYNQAYLEAGGSSDWPSVDRVTPEAAVPGERRVLHASLPDACESSMTVRFVDFPASDGAELPTTIATVPVADVTMVSDTRARIAFDPPAGLAPGSHDLTLDCEGSWSTSASMEVLPDEVPRPTGWTGPVGDAPPVAPGAAGPSETQTVLVGPFHVSGMDHSSYPSSWDGTGTPPLSAYGPIPRPDGSYSIVGASFDLVEADQTTPVPRDEIHLHHFVMLRDGRNDACADGRFASFFEAQPFLSTGMERTPINFPEPYGLLDNSDAWTGVWDVMPMVDTTRDVYVRVTLEIKRGATPANTRNLVPLLHSVTGCHNSFYTYGLDGTGGTDEHRSEMVVPFDSLLVTSGGHQHTSGIHSVLRTLDGDTLCDSPVSYLDDTFGGMGGMGGMTTTTIADPMYNSPPEMFPEDHVIDHISTCTPEVPLHQGQVLDYSAYYDNTRARTGVMGITMPYLWTGSGPSALLKPEITPNTPATPAPVRPRYTG